MSGWDRENCNSIGMHKEDYKMLTCHNYSLLTHFVTANMSYHKQRTKQKSRMNFRMKQKGATQSRDRTNSEEMDTEMYRQTKNEKVSIKDETPE